MFEKKLPPRDVKQIKKRFLKPLRRLANLNYFGFQVRGAHHIPAEGEILFVANHSGWVPLDALFLLLAIHDTAGPEMLPYLIVHDMLIRFPVSYFLLKDLGLIPADWLHYGQEPLPPELNPIIIFPEGANGNSKPFWKAYQMQQWKNGFVRLAIQRKAKVVPVAIVGGEEAVPVAATIDALKPILGSVMPLPLTLTPLPSRWKIQFLEPLDFSAYDPAIIHQPEACAQIAQEVYERVQSRLTQNTQRNPLRWLGHLAQNEPPRE